MKKTVRTNKGGWFSVAITLILFGGMFLFANKENMLHCKMKCDKSY